MDTHASANLLTGSADDLVPLPQVEWRFPTGTLATAADISLHALRGALTSPNDSRLARAAADLVQAAARVADDPDADPVLRAQALAAGADVHRDAVQASEARAERCGRLLGALVQAVAMVTGLALLARVLRPAPEWA